MRGKLVGHGDGTFLAAEESAAGPEQSFQILTCASTGKAPEQVAGGSSD
jgi:hypothetical protein